MKRVHLCVTGLVQGVFFRVHAKKQAELLGLTGYVKNLHDGRVEIVCEGPDGSVNDMIKWSYSGSPGANVEGLKVDFGKVTGEFNSFQILN